MVLIPIDEGCRLFEEELRSGRKGEAEVVIGGAAPAAGPLLAAATAESEPPVAASRRSGASTSTRRYLGDHRVDGRPVFRSPSRWS